MGRFAVIDVTDPYNPTRLGQVSWQGTSPYGLYGLQISGTTAYVAHDNHGLTLIDVSNPAAPGFGNSYRLGGWNARQVQIDGDTIYVANKTGGINTISITSPQAISSIDANDHGYEGLHVLGSYIYASGLYTNDSGHQGVLDILDRSMNRLGSVDLPSWAGYDVRVQGDFAYVADAESGLQIVDVSDPTNSDYSQFGPV